MKPSMKLLAALLLIPTLAFAAEKGVDRKLAVDTTQTVAGQTITVPENPRLQTTVLTIAPGTSLPVHKHPYARYAYVLAGEVDVTLVDAKKVLHFKKGDFFAETIDQWHFGTNNGREPVQLLVIDQMPRSLDSNTIKREEDGH